jgi:thiol-disulfide isomerase/thioredoxin
MLMAVYPKVILMIRFNRAFLTFSAVTLLIFFPCTYVQSGSRIIVTPMDVPELNTLVNAIDKPPRVFVLMAAWCGPCIQELPTLIKLYDKYGAQRLQMFGLSIDLEGPSAMQPILDKLKVNFPVYWVGEKLIEEYNISAIPLILLVKKGEITERLTGMRSERFLEKKFRELLQ